LIIWIAFTPEVGGEVYFRKNGFLSMLGIANWLKFKSGASQKPTDQLVVPPFWQNWGYDKQAMTDLRYRIMGSVYTTVMLPNSYLLTVQTAAGSRYYFVMEDGNCFQPA